MGILSEAGEAVKDLFRHDRVTVIDEHGNEVQKIMKPEPLANPIRLLRMLTWKAWLFYVVGLAAWTVDGYDFHSVSLSVTSLASFYDVTKTQVTTSITLTLLFRSLGAALFGVAGDYYGRKWPMVVNMFIIGALQVATIYAKTYNQFLGVRALFGIGMGGVWGNATAMSLESVPVEARGLLSGILQQGYSLGYLLAAVFTLAFASEGTAPDSYKILFWIGAGASFAVGLIRMCFPESQIFIEAKKDGKRGGHTKLFFSQFGEMVKTQWRMIVYCVVLMALFNLFSHTTQDAYPTFLISGKGFKRSESAKGAIYAKTGAVVGGTFVGYVSQTFGRRRSIVLSALICAAVIPAWILPNTQAGLAVGSFILQFMVQGAWGVVPVHLNELSPPAFRSSFPGIAYQLGNAISSPSAEIVTALAAKYRVTGPNGRRVEGFGPVMGIATAIIAVSLAIWTAVGRENRASHFERGGVAWDDKHQQNRQLDVPKDDMEAGSSKVSQEKRSVEVTHLEEKH